MNYSKAHRRQSLKLKSDQAFIENYINTKGLVQEDVEDAFRLLSKDGKKITKSDIKDFADKYFKGRLKMKQAKIISSWKDEISLDSLSSMLIKKPIGNTPFAEAFEWFDYAETGILTKGELKELFQMCSPYSVMHREDFKTIINQFDFDKDGQLTIDDFKRMSFV